MKSSSRCCPSGPAFVSGFERIPCRTCSTPAESIRGDHNTVLSQQILDVAEAEGELVKQPTRRG